MLKRSGTWLRVWLRLTQKDGELQAWRYRILPLLKYSSVTDNWSSENSEFHEKKDFWKETKSYLKINVVIQ